VWNAPGLEGKWVGAFDCELAKEFFAAFASRAACNLHVHVLAGGNAHHMIECIFKAFARASDAATAVDPRLAGAVPSTKGTLTS
jgi:imidazoleglycerol-phosphate dehydratase